MGIESWMINLAIALGGIVFGYGLFKGKMQAMDDRAIEHAKNDKTNHEDLERRISAQFKRIDAVSQDIANINGRMEKAISLEQAEAKFVSKTEMLLHMKNLELTAANTNAKVDKLEGKLEDILDILSDRRKHV